MIEQGKTEALNEPIESDAEHRQDRRSLQSASAPRILGDCDNRFDQVRDVFADTFLSAAGPYRNLGASLSVYIEGQCAIDLWAGAAGADRPWHRDTLVNVWSATKGIVAIAIAMLVDEGRLSYGDRVAAHWPEFAQAGKHDITVAHVMSHQSGLNGFAEATSIADFYNWEVVTRRLAAQPPFWPPGTQTSYHAMTYGFLAGELIRRVSGMDVRTFVARRLAEPLAADIYIGAPREVRDRVARIIGPKARPPLSEGMNPLAGRAVTNPSLEPEQPNHEGWMGAQIPAGNGHASAPGLARLYGAVANGGRLGDVSLLSREGVDRMRTALSTRQDLMLGSRTWAAGVVLNSQGGYGPNPSTFGHSGWGGSFGCADPDRAVGIGYVHNQMGPDITGDVRGISLCNAIYECLDRA